MKGFFKVLLCFALVFHGFSVEGIPLASFENIPDSAKLRKTIAETWLLAEPSLVQSLKPAEYTDGSGKRFTVESKVQDDILSVIITPYDTAFYKNGTEKQSTKVITLQPQTTKKALNSTSSETLPSATEANTTTESSTTETTAKPEAKTLLQTKQPFASGRTIPQGTWILQRELATGKPISIIVYLRESSDLFIVLHPTEIERIEDKSLIDFCLFSAYVRRDIPINFSFESLYYTSLVDLKLRTKHFLPWHIFDPPEQASSVEVTSKVVSKHLSSLVYIDDGAFDENGKPCYIETGKKQTKEEILKACENSNVEPGTTIRGGVNCSGFVKWIIDGIIKPIAGQGTYIEALKRHSEIVINNFTESFIESRDLFFGLDWIRNLAAARLSLTSKKTVYPEDASIDVNIEPFSLTLPVKNATNSKQSRFTGYFNPSGYQIEYLKALLYYLAITEPNYFYLASVNGEDGKPTFIEHSHVLALFPYFDILGVFHVDVYENGNQTPLEDFIEKNQNRFIALVRVKAPEQGFFAP